jgi:hypothetical protein
MNPKEEAPKASRAEGANQMSLSPTSNANLTNAAPSVNPALRRLIAEQRLEWISSGVELLRRHAFRLGGK